MVKRIYMVRHLAGIPFTFHVRASSEDRAKAAVMDMVREQGAEGWVVSISDLAVNEIEILDGL